MQAIYHKPGAVDEYCRLRYSCAPSVTVSNLLRKSTLVKNDRQSLASLACIAAGKECSMARKLSIVLAVVLAIFAASPISATLKVAAEAGAGGAVAGVGAGVPVGVGAEAAFGSRDGVGFGVRATLLPALPA